MKFAREAEYQKHSVVPVLYPASVVNLLSYCYFVCVPMLYLTCVCTVYFICAGLSPDLCFYLRCIRFSSCVLCVFVPVFICVISALCYICYYNFVVCVFVPVVLNLSAFNSLCVLYQCFFPRSFSFCFL